MLRSVLPRTIPKLVSHAENVNYRSSPFKTILRKSVPDAGRRKVICRGAVKLVWESDIVERIVKPKEYREEVIHG